LIDWPLKTTKDP